VRGINHQNGIFRLLSQSRLWDLPRATVSEAACYARLARADTQPLAQLLAHVGDLLAARLAPLVRDTLAPFATAVYAFDESTLDKVARLLHSLRGLPQGDRALLPGKLAAVFDLRQQRWHHVEHVPNPVQNEKHTMWRLLAHVAPGALIVCDLGYFCFAWFDALTAGGYYFVTRVRKKTSYRIAHVFYQRERVFDGLVWLGAHKADHAQHLVRMVTFAIGNTQYEYLTNVLDPDVFPLHDIAAVYQRRWDIELAFKLIKRTLGLQLLWSSRTSVVLLQVWGVLIVSQILLALRLEIAVRAGVDPFDVSLPLFVEWAPRLAAQGQDPVAVFVAQGRALGFLRPSRRVANRAPHLPRDAIVPAPPDLVTERTPRYAGRRSPTTHDVPAYALD
jgi:hypothetical protein